MSVDVQCYRLPEGQEPLDHYARLIQRTLDVPVGLVSLVEADRQVFPGVLGLPQPYPDARTTPLTHSFCQYVVLDDAPLIVEDARGDERLCDNLAVRDLNVVAYAGWPIRDADGRAIGSLCGIDTKPRTWSEHDLAILEDLAIAASSEVQDRFHLHADHASVTRMLLDTIDVGIAFFDAELRLVLANDLARSLSEMGGIDLDQSPPVGPYVRSADNRAPVPAHEQFVACALDDVAPPHDTAWMGQPGHEVAVMHTAHRVLRYDGTLLGTLITWHDITALARAMQVKEDFVATVSHELRTPLAAVVGYAEVLADELDDLGPPDSAAHNALSVIRRRAHDLEARIEDLLKIADLRRRMHVSPRDVGAIARQVEAAYAPQAALAGVDLTFDVPAPQNAVVDASWIEQSVENLVTNALTYTPAGGRVEVSVSGSQDFVIVAVSDSGIGMTPDEVDQACDRFWRSDHSHREAIPGFGIGLTLVRDVVSAHHGSLAIDSKPSLGTVVRLELPRTSARAKDR